MRRDHVASTLIRRHFDAVYLLGIVLVFTAIYCELLFGDIFFCKKYLNKKKPLPGCMKNAFRCIDAEHAGKKSAEDKFDFT